VSKETELLARQLVQLDQAITRAAKTRQFWEAYELEQAREHLVELRSAVLRKEWAERRVAV
jgi:flagellar biosynthesis chaperone FliJ